MARWFAMVSVGGFALWAGTACFEETPCDRYVEYLCDCHGDDPEIDCTALQNTYANADAAGQDACEIALAEQEQADAESGHVCTAGSDSGL